MISGELYRKFAKQNTTETGKTLRIDLQGNTPAKKHLQGNTSPPHTLLNSARKIADDDNTAREFREAVFTFAPPYNEPYDYTNEQSVLAWLRPTHTRTLPRPTVHTRRLTEHHLLTTIVSSTVLRSAINKQKNASDGQSSINKCRSSCYSKTS